MSLKKSMTIHKLPKFMLRLMAPKNFEPLKENIFDFSSGASSASLDVYIIPALKVNSASIQVRPKTDSKIRKDGIEKIHKYERQPQPQFIKILKRGRDKPCKKKLLVKVQHATSKISGNFTTKYLHIFNQLHHRI